MRSPGCEPRRIGCTRPTSTSSKTSSTRWPRSVRYRSWRSPRRPCPCSRPRPRPERAPGGPVRPSVRGPRGPRGDLVHSPPVDERDDLEARLVVAAPISADGGQARALSALPTGSTYLAVAAVAVVPARFPADPRRDARPRAPHGGAAPRRRQRQPDGDRRRLRAALRAVAGQARRRHAVDRRGAELRPAPAAARLRAHGRRRARAGLLPPPPLPRPHRRARQPRARAARLPLGPDGAAGGHADRALEHAVELRGPPRPPCAGPRRGRVAGA